MNNYESTSMYINNFILYGRDIFQSLPKNLLIVLFATLVTGCGVAVKKDATTSVIDIENAAIYCDSYFIYDMCAVDADKDSVVDYMYFEDTLEIFMVNPGYSEIENSTLSLHDCLLTMDDSLLESSSKLLEITKKTSALEKAKIKSKLMINYSRYLSEISNCENSSGNSELDQSESSDVDFGDEDYEEF